ncbi:MAG: hemerythrin family protein [Elainellaceae cyanobacterium]
MKKFEWMESLSVGVPVIDAQHQEIIAAFNDLSDAIEQGNGAASVQTLMIFLQHVIEWHVEHEETCAAQYGCAIAEKKRYAHVQFLKMFKVLQTQYRESGASDEIARNAHAQLADWLVSHILTVDTQFGRCVHTVPSPAAIF